MNKPPLQFSRQEIIALCKNNMHTIRINMKKLMIEHNISQAKLAQSIEKEDEYICYILNNKNSSISVKTLTALAAGLNTTISELTKKQ